MKKIPSWVIWPMRGFSFGLNVKFLETRRSVEVVDGVVLDRDSQRSRVQRLAPHDDATRCIIALFLS
jgi:hypothetical protein